MSFQNLPQQGPGARLLQRSLERGRLGHAYLFAGHQLPALEAVAGTLAKTLNCLQPRRSRGGVAVDCCDTCLSCRKIEHGNHADVHWARPESKSRIITVDQMRELMRQIQLKPTEAEYKVAVIVAADRLRTEAANAFLKTLEEPPPKSVLILLTTDSQRLLDTIRSRCLRMNFAGEGVNRLDPASEAWLASFTEQAAVEQKSLLGRYRLMDVLLQKLNQTKAEIEEALKSRSPLEQYKDAEKELRDKWEDELTAAIEAEYRRQRADLLALLQNWLRDVWLLALDREYQGRPQTQPRPVDELICFPQISGTNRVAARISPRAARENLQVVEQLQSWLATNVQEALALEVGLLKLVL